MFKLTRTFCSSSNYLSLLEKSACSYLWPRRNLIHLQNGHDLLHQSQPVFSVIKSSFIEVYSIKTRYLCRTSVLFKKDKKSAKETRSVNLDSDDEDDYNKEEIDDDLKEEKGSKVIKTKVNSLRADVVMKAGLGMARKWVLF